jgi:hypothetical protein
MCNDTTVNLIPILNGHYPVALNDRSLNICIPAAIALPLYNTTHQRGSSAFRSLRSHRSHQLKRRCSRWARFSNISSSFVLLGLDRSLESQSPAAHVSGFLSLILR